MSGYLADPATFTDEQLAAWVKNLREQPPSLDTMQDRIWADKVWAEAKRREENS